ncbi:hypothetical protein [Patulibacter sp. SYSU D01012]|uniref:hypothetical protein n=1 Tax=Patulibacter sp. SYSU D01012 TaxID=2817381 RepID=UPI001B303538|nr:hypothetical protein [Patulibacter sp. SYSU D01012]
MNLLNTLTHRERTGGDGPDWAAVDPDGQLPAAFRQAFAVVGPQQVVVPHADVEGHRIITVNTPVRPSEDGPVFDVLEGSENWLFRGATWRVVGVSVSEDEAWQGLPVPEVPVRGPEWATVAFSIQRCAPAMIWAPPHEGRRVTVVASFQRPEAWVLAMPVDEILVRLLTGTTGCPWLDRPKPVALRGSAGLEAAPAPEGAGPDGEGRSNDASPSPGAPAVPRVEVLVPESQPAKPFPEPDAEQTRSDLERLGRLVPAPETPDAAGTWDGVERALGGPVPPHLRALLETYGPGVFAQDDEDAWSPVDTELLELRGNAFIPIPESQLDAFDLHDVIGDAPADALRAVAWCTVDRGTLHELWAWRLGADSGLARSDQDHVARLEGSAAAVLLDALTRRDRFGDMVTDTDIGEHPIVFRPN